MKKSSDKIANFPETDKERDLSRVFNICRKTVNDLAEVVKKENNPKGSELVEKLGKVVNRLIKLEQPRSTSKDNLAS